MKLIKYFVIIYLFIFSNLVINAISMYYQRGSKEKFTPFYQDCINSGYTKEFCSQTPTNVLGASGCLCDDGSLGYIVPGFGGRCVCNI
jgi:hypothetical protein